MIINESCKRDNAEVFIYPCNKRIMEGIMEDTDRQTFQYERLTYIPQLYQNGLGIIR